MIRLTKFAYGVFALSLLSPLAARAEEPAEAETAYTQEQLDQITAPIALYPDTLVTQIFVASTHPLDVVEASRWLKKPGNAQLVGDQLADAVAPLPWDSSVKALVNAPQVVAMMNNNLEWTEELGDAFLEQGEDLTASVQRLRQMAAKSGYLTSTPQQTVAMEEDGDIDIVPADPQLVYLPTYNPALVYGAWPYPEYQPYYFAPPPGAQITAISYPTHYVVVEKLWNVPPRDLHRHRVDPDNHQIAETPHEQAQISQHRWTHGPKHRVAGSVATAAPAAPVAPGAQVPVVPVAGPAVPPVVAPSAPPVLPIAGPAVPSQPVPIPVPVQAAAPAQPAAPVVSAQNRGARNGQQRGLFHRRFRPEDPQTKEDVAAPAAAPTPAVVQPVAQPAVAPQPQVQPQQQTEQQQPAPTQPAQQQQTNNGSVPDLPLEVPHAHEGSWSTRQHGNYNRSTIPASASPGDNGSNSSTWRDGKPN
jgi:hypothetical protein